MAKISAARIREIRDNHPHDRKTFGEWLRGPVPKDDVVIRAMTIGALLSIVIYHFIFA